MKIVGNADTMITKLDKKHYTPTNVTVNGQSWSIIAEKKTSRLKNFFNVKLLVTDFSSWKEQAIKGKKVIKFTGPQSDYNKIQFGLHSALKTAKLTDLGLKALGNKPKVVDPYPEDLDLLEGPPILKNYTEEEKEILQEQKAELKSDAINPYAKVQELEGKIDQLPLESIETLQKVKDYLDLDIAGAGMNGTVKSSFYLLEVDQGNVKIHLKTRGIDKDDRCLIGRERVDLHYHDLQKFIQELHPDATVFATT